MADRRLRSNQTDSTYCEGEGEAVGEADEASLFVLVVELDVFLVEELPVPDPELAAPCECMLLLELVVVTVSVRSAQAPRSATAARSVRAKKAGFFMFKSVGDFGGERRRSVSRGASIFRRGITAQRTEEPVAASARWPFTLHPPERAQEPEQ
ncbi:MAG: hypothetical protein H0T11_01635 [Chthoniobacterales bacterium]|nr:hypothetical protein [Chthoniobacterales bacterium]